MIVTSFSIRFCIGYDCSIFVDGVGLKRFVLLSSDVDLELSGTCHDDSAFGLKRTQLLLNSVLEFQ